jgi:hypothetical protein
MSDLVERANSWLNTWDRFGKWPIMRELVAEVERLHSWQGLMSLLDEHYPESIFPTTEDDEDRDSGPRIVSLIRRINGLEEDNQTLRIEKGQLQKSYEEACDAYDRHIGP